MAYNTEHISLSTMASKLSYNEQLIYLQEINTWPGICSWISMYMLTCIIIKDIIYWHGCPHTFVFQRVKKLTTNLTTCIPQFSHRPLTYWIMATYQGQHVPLADSDVESEEEYIAEGEDELTEEQKRMEELVNAIKNG